MIHVQYNRHTMEKLYSYFFKGMYLNRAMVSSCLVLVNIKIHFLKSSVISIVYIHGTKPESPPILSQHLTNAHSHTENISQVCGK